VIGRQQIPQNKHILEFINWYTLVLTIPVIHNFKSCFNSQEEKSIFANPSEAEAKAMPGRLYIANPRQG
jgi:hypothetical protein